MLYKSNFCKNLLQKWLRKIFLKKFREFKIWGLDPIYT
jgi:hypothetical protein